jgi:hypothetical protein
MLTERINYDSLQIKKGPYTNKISRGNSPTSILKKKVSFKYNPNFEDLKTTDSN